MISEVVSEHKGKILGVIVALYLLFTLVSINDILVMDEHELYEPAKGVLSQGVPIYYIDELIPEQLSIWHPPLYFYSLALTMKIFGIVEWSARLFSIVFSLGTLFLIYFTGRKLFAHKKYRDMAALLASLVYAISPFVIQSSLLVDIDGSLLTFMTALFFYVFVSKTSWSFLSNRTLLGIILGLILFSKLQGFIVLVPAIGLYLLLTRSFMTALKQGLHIVLTSLALFLVLWTIYTTLSGIPFTAPFTYTLSIGADPWAVADENTLKKVLRVVFGAKNLLFWTTPAFFLLVFLFAFTRIKNYSKRRTLEPIDFFLLYGLTTITPLLLFKSQAYGFPKYCATMMPALAFVVAAQLGSFLAGEKYKVSWFHLGVIGALLIPLHIFVVQDPFITHNFFYHSDISPSANIPLYLKNNIMGLVVFFAPLVAAFSLLLVFKQGWYNSLLLALGIVLVFNSLHINVVQATADYNTIYYYGQEGLEETLAYLHENTPENGLIMGRHDIGYYWGGKFIHPFTNYEPLLEGQGYVFDYVVISPKDKIRPYSSDSFEIDGTAYTLETQIGHFKLFTPS